MKYLSLSIPWANGTPMQIDQDAPGGVPTGGLATGPTSGQNIMWTFINLVLVIAILVTLVFIFWGALDIMTSRGNKEEFKKGREKVIFAILGLVAIFLSFFAVSVGGAFFKTNLFTLPFS